MSAWLAGGAEVGAVAMEPELSESCGAVGIFFPGSNAEQRGHSMIVWMILEAHFIFYYSNQHFTSQTFHD
jgi:hypothetical protein